jgi:hypothetical protein
LKYRLLIKCPAKWGGSKAKGLAVSFKSGTASTSRLLKRHDVFWEFILSSGVAGLRTSLSKGEDGVLQHPAGEYAVACVGEGTAITLKLSPTLQACRHF